jgi:hypothetical protein
VVEVEEQAVSEKPPPEAYIAFFRRVVAESDSPKPTPRELEGWDMDADLWRAAQAEAYEEAADYIHERYEKVDSDVAVEGELLRIEEAIRERAKEGKA